MAEDAGKIIVHLDVAKSGRSTCRATGEKIEKGEHRVGVEAYTGGHISMTWQKLVPFLEGCSVEYSKSSTGADKKTGQKFAKGDARFVVTTKGSRILLSLKSASEELQPVLEEAKDFKLLSMKGLENLKENDRAEFFKHFSVSAAEQNTYNKEHPAPADQPSSPPAKKRKVARNKAKAAKEDEEDEEDDAEAEEQEEEEEAAEHAETATDQPKIGNKAVVGPSSSPSSDSNPPAAAAESKSKSKTKKRAAK
ncbi:hypothetical protein ABBQ32_004367 [Trebouxia sp. C0010 RCD-2024]